MRLKGLAIALILAMISFSVTSYAISVWLKTLKVPISLINPTSQIKFYKIDTSNIIQQNLSIINPDINCNSYYCVISKVNIENSNSIIIFGVKVANLDTKEKEVYIDMSLYPYLNQSVLYGIGTLTDSCSFVLNNACINIEELKRYPDEFKLETLEPGEEKDYIVYLYVPEVLESTDVNLTFKITLV